MSREGTKLSFQMFHLQVIVDGLPVPFFRDPRETTVQGTPLYYVECRYGQKYFMRVTARYYGAEYIEVRGVIDNLDLENKGPFDVVTSKGILLPNGQTYDVGFRENRSVMHPAEFTSSYLSTAVTEMGASVWSVGSMGVIVNNGYVNRPRPVARPAWDEGVYRGGAPKSLGLEGLTMKGAPSMGSKVSDDSKLSQLGGSLPWERTAPTEMVMIRYRTMMELVEAGIWAPETGHGHRPSDYPFGGEGGTGGWHSR